MRAHASVATGGSAAARTDPIRVPACACHGRSNQAIQAKLRIGAQDDPLERAADRAADRVIAGGFAGPLNTASAAAQRKCTACHAEQEEMVRRQTAEEDKNEELRLEARVGGPNASGGESAAAAVSNSGRPLPSEVRSYFEPRFGQDLSGVRTHDHAPAHRAASAINARAFTLGRDIAFGRSEYAPSSSGGMRLLAHELAHVVQQGAGGGSRLVQRENGSGSASTASASTRSYGRACTGGTNDPCQHARCGRRHTGIRNDFTRAIELVDGAVRALGETPRSDATTRALDWYFNDASRGTAQTVRTRLGCIRDCLTDSQTNVRYGCHPDYDANAYVCVSATPACQHVQTPICLTDSHFGNGNERRAQTLIHECAHRVGMSLGTAQSVDDIYEHTSRFAFLDTNEALLNSDSYALFVGAIRNGVPLGMPAIWPTLSGGVAVPGRGRATWQARLYLGTEFQQPVLGIFNPTLGVGLSVIGETTREGPAPVSSGPSMLASLLAGVRIGDPRPGSAGGGYVSMFAGPSLAISGSGVGVGAEAGMAVGYRWRWLDVSAGPGYAYDPTREAGMEHLFTLGANLTFIPFSFTQ